MPTGIESRGSPLREFEKIDPVTETLLTQLQIGKEDILGHFPTLYKKNSRGKMKVWKVIVTSLLARQANDGPLEYLAVNVVTFYGLENMKFSLHSRSVREGKNIGKSNETDPLQQGILRAGSAWNKKLDQGYQAERESAKDYKVPPTYWKPMLAKDIKSVSILSLSNIMVQPKLDGVRMMAAKHEGKVYMWSRIGKDLTTSLPRIKKDLEHFMPEGACYDGEVYKHGWGFQKIVSGVKSKDRFNEDLEYWIFDCPDPSNLEISFEERWDGGLVVIEDKNGIRRWERFSTWQPNEAGIYGEAWDTISLNDALLLGETASRIRDSNLHGPAIAAQSSLRILQTFHCDDKDEVLGCEQKFVEEGYEGLILRDATAPYKFGSRSASILKLKRFQDAEFLIVGVKEGEGVEEGCAIFRCISTGGFFFVRPKGSHEERRKIYEKRDDYLFKLLKVKFQGSTDKGLPRFPVGMGIREDWDIEDLYNSPSPLLPRSRSSSNNLSTEEGRIKEIVRVMMGIPMWKEFTLGDVMMDAPKGIWDAMDRGGGLNCGEMEALWAHIEEMKSKEKALYTPRRISPGNEFIEDAWDRR